MMGPSHALSGAAVWLAGCWALDRFADYEQSALAVAVGTAVCAGSALLPDLDMSGKVTANRGGATVARTFGVLSLFVAEVIEKFSLGVYHATKLRKDPDRTNGHRTLTHTLPFTVLVGWGTTAACAAYGRWAVIGILFFTIGLALRGLFEDWAQRVGWATVTLISTAAAFGAYVALPADRGYPMLGFAVGVGCLVHILGDLITSAGVPVLWPVPVGGRTWRMIGTPDGVALRVGGRVEVVAVRGALTLVALLAGTDLYFPSVLPALPAILEASR